MKTKKGKPEPQLHDLAAPAPAADDGEWEPTPEQGVRLAVAVVLLHAAARVGINPLVHESVDAAWLYAQKLVSLAKSGA
jgi:hypothetical protein